MFLRYTLGAGFDSLRSWIRPNHSSRSKGAGPRPKVPSPSKPSARMAIAMYTVEIRRQGMA